MLLQRMLWTWRKFWGWYNYSLYNMYPLIFAVYISVQFSHSVMSKYVQLFATSWTVADQASLSITNSRSLLKLISIESVMPSYQLILSCPLLLLPSIFPSIRVFSNKSALRIFGSAKHVIRKSVGIMQVAKVLEFQLQHQSFQWTSWTDLLYDGLVGSPCSPRDSQESSSTPHLQSINSSTFSFLHSPTLTSIHDYGKNHSFD